MTIRKVLGITIDSDTIDGLNAQNAASQVPVLDANADLPDAQFPRFTANKLKQGAGAGSDPTEIDVPSADYPMKINPNILNWTLPGWAAKAISTQTLANGRIYYTPIFVEETTTYDRIGLEVTTQQAGSIELRIYAWVNGLPAALILDCGSIDTSANGLKELVIDQELTRGYYFLAQRCLQINTAFKSIDETFWMKPPVASVSLTADHFHDKILMRVDAAWADPAPAPTAVEKAEFVILELREA